MPNTDVNEFIDDFTVEMIVKIPCSPEQKEIILDHLQYGHELGMEVDERHWMVNQLDKLKPGYKITKADLDVETCSWTLNAVPKT